MKYALLLACATLGVALQSATAETCKPLQMVASLDMTVAHGRALVPVTVADETVYFAISTASPYSSISAAFAESHHFPRHHIDKNIVGLDGEIMNQMATVPTFGLGGMHNERFELLVTPGRNEPVPPGAKISQGMIGADILRNYDVEIDFAANKLNLISREHCDAMPVYWPSAMIAKLPMLVTDQNKITFKMNLDGHELQAVLSTGMVGSSIRKDLAKSTFDIDENAPDTKPSRTLRDGTQLYAHKFQKLSVEGLEITNPVLVLMPSKADEEISHLRHLHGTARNLPMEKRMQPDLTLGLNELKQLHVYVDYHHQMIYFTPAEPKPN